MEDMGGFEPPTHGLRDRCSDPLSYMSAPFLFPTLAYGDDSAAPHRMRRDLIPLGSVRS